MLSALWKWLFGGSLFLCIMLGIALQIEKRHSTKVEAQLVKCGQARHADQEAYRKAQADAQALNKAQLERIESEQQRISDHAELSYEADLARLRAELAKRLPHGGTPAPQGAPLNPGASQVPDAPGKPDEEARVCIPSSLYVRGAENELQLERLIDWVSEQSKVDQNKP
jgi:hypothetical protein